VVQAIQKEGYIAVMQIFYCGRMGWPEINPANRFIAVTPGRMSQFDIDHVI